MALNCVINTQIEMKKLRFHTPDERGKSKCHKMHVGWDKSECQVLKVHGTEMQQVTEDTYLGDVISCDGKNTKNIQSRISKGLGIITQIMNLLEMVNFGGHFFQIAMLLRDSMFINGILTNAECWYNLTKSEVKELDSLDKLLLRKILQVPSSTPGEAFHLELGIIPVEVIIKARRINFLHYLATRKEHQKLSAFFQTQWNNPCRGDWTEEVKTDLEELEIGINLEMMKTK